MIFLKQEAARTNAFSLKDRPRLWGLPRAEWEIQREFFALFQAKAAPKTLFDLEDIG